MNEDKVKAEIELHLKNVKLLDLKYVAISVESLNYLKEKAFKKSQKPIWDKNFGHLCKDCGNVVEMDDLYCSRCGCEQDWEAMFDECF